jgi:arsenate reductase
MKTVLFVCVGNAGRSQMAEAFFNQAAGGKARALSAGTKPASAVDPRTIEVMREVGIDISRNKPKALTMEMMDQADRVVTMGCGVEGVCPASFVETEDWQLEDPKGKPIEDVRRIRDEIRAKVLKLLEKSKAQKPSQ